MDGPFPGMDPYLEEPEEWRGVHLGLTIAVCDALAPKIVPRFFARTRERVYIPRAGDMVRGAIFPDIYVVQHPRSGTASTSTFTVSPPTLVEPYYDTEVHDRYVEILDARNREMVTTIEILSPANKTAGTRGRAQFLKKRRAVLSSPTHWIEIDLLREGARPKEVAGKSDYYTLLRRKGDRLYTVWYSDLRDRLPTIEVPLLPPHPDVPLDLQALLNGVYSRAFYGLSVDYTRPVPLPPLLPPDATWAAARVRDWRAAQAIPSS